MNSLPKQIRSDRIARIEILCVSTKTNAIYSNVCDGVAGVPFLLASLPSTMIVNRRPHFHINAIFILRTAVFRCVCYEIILCFGESCGEKTSRCLLNDL